MVGLLKSILPEALVRRLWIIKSIPGCLISNARKLLGPDLHSGKKGKDIMGVWDFKTVPWAIGDFIIFVQMLNIKRELLGSERINFCIVCDRHNPAGNRGETWVTNQNYRYYLFKLLPVIETLPSHGSVFFFDDREEYWDLLRQRGERYYIFPSLPTLLAETFNFYGGADMAMEQEYFRLHGAAPHLVVHDNYMQRTHELFGRTLEGRIPVTMSIRNQISNDEIRNTDQNVWLDFIKKCQELHPEVLFYIVCNRDEIFPGLREQPNVVLSKDHGFGLSEDMALIRSTLLYMGMASGINWIAVYSNQPYMIFGFPSFSGRHMGLEQDAIWNFSTKEQRLFWDTFEITSESIMKEFSALYGSLDVEAWRGRAAKHMDA